MSQLTLFAEDSPANPSLLPGSDWARQMTATSGLSISGLSKNSGPLGSLEKMLLASSIWASTMCYLTWKAQGTPQGHLLYRLSPSMRNTEEIDSGLWPTPTCNMISGGANHASPSVSAGKHGLNLTGAVAMWPTPTAHTAKETNAPSEAFRNEPTLASLVGGSLNPQWVEWLMGYPIGWTDLKD